MKRNFINLIYGKGFIKLLTFIKRNSVTKEQTINKSKEGCGYCTKGCLINKPQEQEARKQSFLKYPNYGGYMPYICHFYEKPIFRSIADEHKNSASIVNEGGKILWKKSFDLYRKEFKELLLRSSQYKIKQDLFLENCCLHQKSR
ncbi:MAG: hypothetical protein JW974_03900 [Alphaproteobacteria bacterium]|nr:hypothetical protein [Alphaproteobacteria bacterium]MBN2675131.1 hypothetical protein [Alphaproteobacteria bacterium]